MKNIFKLIYCFSLALLLIFSVSCGVKKEQSREVVSLSETVLSEVEFENSDKTKIEQMEGLYEITGEITAMSKAQKSAFGVQDVTHVVVIKFVFDKERTIDTFEIKGNVTKVYSTDKTKENYVGSLSSILDNKSSEDAYSILILSANTKEYTLTSTYSDGTVSKINLNITANLVTAEAE